MSHSRSHDAQLINFRWLLRLRWWVLVGQICTVVSVEWVLRIDLPLGPLAAAHRPRHRQQRRVRAVGTAGATRAGGAVGGADGVRRAAADRPAVLDRRAAQSLQLPLPGPHRPRRGGAAAASHLDAGGIVVRLLRAAVRHAGVAAGRRRRAHGAHAHAPRGHVGRVRRGGRLHRLLRAARDARARRARGRARGGAQPDGAPRALRVARHARRRRGARAVDAALDDRRRREGARAPAAQPGKAPRRRRTRA